MTARIPIGIVMNGVTGRMGYHQHLVRSLLAIRDAGGVPLRDGSVLAPELVLVGRNEAKLRDVASRHGLADWTTDLGAALARTDMQIYFDAQVTGEREKAIGLAIEAGKHIYTEKPLATTLHGAVELARAADAAGVRHGVVQDKLFLPGLRKLQRLISGGFFGRILSVRGEFGYWVFEGDLQPIQRPSWNYRKAEGGGIILDMLCHWRYVLDNLFGEVKAVSCLGMTHIPERFDEAGKRYAADADDAAYATFELAGGVVAQINSSWCSRVKRDDLVTFHADGTHGSAVAGLTRCFTQNRVNTPRPVWNPDVPQSMVFQEQWQEVPDTTTYDNGFKLQWEEFIRHIFDGAAWKYDLMEGVKGVQLAELGLKSSAERRWLTVPDLSKEVG